MKRKYAIALGIALVSVISIVVIGWFLVSLLLKPVREQIFWTACVEGNITTVKRLLDEGVPIDARDGWSSTCMFYAAGNGHTDIVKLLLERGVDIDSQYRLNKTALIVAAQGGRVSTVKFLINKGANIQITDRNGKRALDHAKENGKDEIEKILRKFP